MDLEAAHVDGFGIIAGFRFQLSEFDASIPQGYDPNLAYASTLSLEEFQRFFFTLNGWSIYFVLSFFDQAFPSMHLNRIL